MPLNTRTLCSLIFLSLCFLQLLAYGSTASIRSKRATPPTCGYESCPKADPNKLNIHLVAHTHDDVGWLKTVDQYYFGSRGKIQKAGVQYIIDSVIQALLADPARRFIYVETAFLWKWWLRQSEKVKEDVRTLINEGRLEIIGGAWSMNDEATTHYHSLIDQFTWGFRRLNDTFGECARPRIGWQIDPFGHSREQASLFAQMGFDGMLFGRIDYQDKSKRLREKSMEFIWKASPSLGKRANLFTAAMFNTYSPPPGFCFDVLCSDEPMIDDPDSPDYNVDERINSFLKYAVNQAGHYRTNNIILTMGGDFTYQHAEMYYTNLDKLISNIKSENIRGQVELFVAYAQIQARSYRTNNIILTMGDDFNYQHAEMWFGNLDKLIRYTNGRNGSTVNVFYSTPSCYLKALHDAKLTWPTKSDDFFPYASDPHAYWTGYFTSRPTGKFMERMGNNLLQVNKQLNALTNLKNYEKELEHFREAMGVMQHHDAVTGTEKQHVADDYSRLLYESMSNGANAAGEAVWKWMTGGNAPRCEFHMCFELNVSSCEYTENSKRFLVAVYNPLSRQVSTYVRLPVQGNSYTVRDYKGDVVTSQVVPIPETVQNIPGRVSEATKEVVFRATEVPALGYQTFVLEEKVEAQAVAPSSESSIGGELFDITVNNAGEIVVQYKQRNMNFVQSFHYYEGAEGDNKVFANRSSGAYIFRPKDIPAKNFAYSGSYRIFKGPLVEEIHQTVNDWVSQVIRVYQGEEHIEFDWLVGPIPVKDKIGKEIVTRYSSSLKTERTFYTDSNGREMLKRVKDYRPTWDLELHEPVSGNYYPIASKIAIADQERSLKLSVLTDRSQGGTSLKDGEIEVMLHRRLLVDDAFGVAEALNESAYGVGLVVRGTHHVFGGSARNLDVFALKEKELELNMALRAWPLIAEPSCTEGVNCQLQASGLLKSLPPNVNILTLEPWREDTILLRLEHIFEVGESSEYSQPVEVNLKDLFSTFTILSLEETTLGGNQWKKDSNPLQWTPDTNEVLQESEETVQPVHVGEEAINVLLKPKEIRTFIVKISPNRSQS